MRLRLLSAMLMMAITFWAFSMACAAGKEEAGEVDFRITIEAPEASRDVKVWIPYPVSDPWQSIADMKIEGNYNYSGIYREKETGNLALYAEWTAPARDRYINLSFKASATERVKKGFPSTEQPFPAEVKPYLEETAFIPLDGKVREVALKATKGKKGVLQKAEAVYDWTIENTFRDPDVQGCGIGDVEMTLAQRGGKCADISSVFVAVARSAGIPAREVFGLRLGKKDGDDITGGHHCWAEFYLPGYGWIPVDPADVRKAMLVNKLELKDAREYRDYYFGAVDTYRIALATGGRGYYLSPPQKDGPLNYFMYPYAEIDGKQIDWLAGQKELKYKIVFKKAEK